MDTDTSHVEIKIWNLIYGHDKKNTIETKSLHFLATALLKHKLALSKMYKLALFVNQVHSMRGYFDTLKIKKYLWNTVYDVVFFR